jgi:hypothetical protein
LIESQSLIYPLNRLFWVGDVGGSLLLPVHFVIQFSYSAT